MPAWKKAIGMLLLLVLVASIVVNLRTNRETHANARFEFPGSGETRRAVAERLERERPLADDRLARIQQELSDLAAHPWAGAYGRSGEGAESARLLLAPKSGFVYLRTASDGARDLNHGTVLSAKPHRIQIAPVIDVAQNQPRLFGTQSIAALDTDLVPVEWGTRHYLIPNAQMHAFCNSVNAGTETAHPNFLHRLDDELGKAPTGLPAVPEAFHDWLLAEPIEAELIQVLVGEAQGDRHARPMQAMLNVGKANGVVPGMRFFLDRVRGYDAAEVLECDERTCKVEFTLDVGHTRDIERLRVGWKLSTRALAP